MKRNGKKMSRKSNMCVGGSVCGGEVCVWRVLGGLVGGRGEGICGGREARNNL